MQFRHPAAVPKVVIETSISHPSVPLIPIGTRQVVLLIAVRRNHPALAGGHHLGREKGERRAIRQFPACHSAKSAAVSVSGILYYKQAAAPAGLHNFRELGRDDSSDMD